ncbi:ead/Ea22-like family protein [Escherichia coli]|nr:ead/Ea22-like family protein [Escherichia coli]MCR4232131.1 ead/Ea22-like family protein [Escherichia coli]
MSNIDKQALNQEKIEWLNKLADMEYCKSNPGHWLMSLKDTNMLAKLALRSVALLASLEAAEKRIAELEARAFNPAILDVIAERQRQQSVEGWMPEHDDEHCNGELAMAAVCYINETGTVNRNGGKPWGWPWDASWWKPNARRRNLVKAGALILAEIERIDRAAGIGKGE